MSIVPYTAIAIAQVNSIVSGRSQLSPTTAPTTPQNGSSKVTFNELPEAVKKTVKEQAGSNEINDIDKNVKNGKAVYEVGFKKNGQQTEILVNEDGSLQK